MDDKSTDHKFETSCIYKNIGSFCKNNSQRCLITNNIIIMLVITTTNTRSLPRLPAGLVVRLFLILLPLGIF